jgi:hypothetical protein
MKTYRPPKAKKSSQVKLTFLAPRQKLLPNKISRCQMAPNYASTVQPVKVRNHV